VIYLIASSSRDGVWDRHRDYNTSTTALVERTHDTKGVNHGDYAEFMQFCSKMRELLIRSGELLSWMEDTCSRVDLPKVFQGLTSTTAAPVERLRIERSLA